MADIAKKEYRNVFAELGIHQAEVETRLQEIIRFYFYGEEQERVYYPVGEDMAYIMDTGNLDVRTEGMSYGMMLCVQLDMKKEFDCLWKWAKTYMYMAEGENEGYFVYPSHRLHSRMPMVLPRMEKNSLPWLCSLHPIDGEMERESMPTRRKPGQS